MHDPTPIDVDDATDPLSLWRLLVSGPAGRALLPTVAVDAFRRLHHGGEPGALDTALLLCTDWRWRRVSAKVIAGVVDSGILDDEDQDRLADELLWHEHVRYRHPTWWIGTTFVEFDLTSSTPARTIHADPDSPTVAHRRVWPPLRAWAAGRVLMRRRASASDVLTQARTLPARDAAAVATGAMRVIDHLDPHEAQTILNAALAWGHKAPRQAALEWLHRDGQIDRASALAQNDPDASIRQWAREQANDTDAQGSLFE